MKAALVKERERLQQQAEAGRAEGLRAAVRILAVLVLVLALRQRPYKRLGSSSPWAGTEARSVQRTSRAGSCNWPKWLEFGALGFEGGIKGLSFAAAPPWPRLCRPGAGRASSEGTSLGSRGAASGCVALF